AGGLHGGCGLGQQGLDAAQDDQFGGGKGGAFAVHGAASFGRQQAAKGLVQRQTGGGPPAGDCPLGQGQEQGRLLARVAVIEEQPERLALLDGQGLGGLVEARPQFQVVGSGRGDRAEVLRVRLGQASAGPAY